MDRVRHLLNMKHGIACSLDKRGENFTVSSKHYTVCVPIRKYDKGKIELSEGAGAKFIAPENVMFKIKKEVFFNHGFECDCYSPLEPTLIFGYGWIGKDIDLVPDTEEVRHILDLIARHTGWHKPDWELIVESEKNRLAGKRSTPPSDILDRDIADILEKRLCLTKSGRVCDDKLVGLNEYAYYWNAWHGCQPGNAFGRVLVLKPDRVAAGGVTVCREVACSVRLVTD